MRGGIVTTTRCTVTSKEKNSECEKCRCAFDYEWKNDKDSNPV